MSSIIRVLIALLMMTPVLGFGPIRTGIAWRKFEYRNLAKLSLNDVFHDKLCMNNESYAQKFVGCHKSLDSNESWVVACLISQRGLFCS